MTDEIPRPLSAFDRFWAAYHRVHTAYDGECEHGFGPPATRCPNPDCTDKELAEAWDALAAEFAARASAVPALDVKLLTTALDNVWARGGIDDDHEEAEQIAAEYARLAAARLPAEGEPE